MIWNAVDDAALASESEALAVRLAKAPAAALAAIKTLFAAATDNTLHRQLDLKRGFRATPAAWRISPKVSARSRKTDRHDISKADRPVHSQVDGCNPESPPAARTTN